MKAIKNFEEFVRENIVKKQSIDKSRAEFLIREAEKSYRNLVLKIEKIELNEDSASDFVKSCYDILMECIRAKMLLSGYNAAGTGAHEAEVSFLRVLKFNEKEVQFLDQIRYFRNGITYYGKSIDKEYAEKVITFTKKIYDKLK